MDHTVFTLQTHHACLYVVSVQRTAPPRTSNSSHLIAAYYSFIDPKRMEGWVGLVRLDNFLLFLTMHVGPYTTSLTSLITMTHTDDSRGSKAFILSVCLSGCLSARQNQNGCHRNSPSWACPFTSRSICQRSRSRDHKVQEHISGDRVTGVSLQLYRVPIV